MKFFENRNVLILIISFSTFLLLINFLPFSDSENKGLALLFLVAVLWLTEALHITVTALMIPVAGILLGLVDTKVALDAFSNPLIFLFFGGFALSTALNKQGLDRLIANKMISLSKGNFLLAILFLFITTAFLSMGISNMATAALMLPLALGLLRNLDYKENKSTYVFVLLGIAYSANLGGLGTLVGSAPNVIVASHLKLTFSDWLQYGIPIVAILFPATIFILYLMCKPNLKTKVEIDVADGKLNTKQIITIFIFLFVAIAWIFSKQLNIILSDWIGVEKITKLDSVIALLGVILICAFNVAKWNDIEKSTDWGVLLLFGGGLTLSAILTNSGGSAILVDNFAFLINGSHLIVISLVVATFIIFLTEFTSNTASAALMVPIFISIAGSLGVDDGALAMIIGFGASCAFMLPVATPPNALAFGTGFVEQKDMMRIGFVLNIFCIIAIGIFAYIFWL